jgi:hypothetical protein
MLADIVDVTDDIVVPETQNGPAFLLQPHGSDLVIVRTCVAVL